MQALPTRSKVLTSLVLACLLASVPAHAEELWEIFAPAEVAEKKQEQTEPPPLEAFFGRDDKAPDRSPDHASGSAPHDFQEPDTAEFLVSDLGSVETAPVTRAESQPSAASEGNQELWAIFAQAINDADRIRTNSEGQSSVFVSGPGLSVTQAVEEIPPAFFEPLTLPPTATAAVNADEAVTLQRPIEALTLDAAVRPELREGIARLEGSLAIQDIAVDRFGAWEAPQYDASMAAPRFTEREFRWASPAFYSRPLYFEQPNLERYGHHVALCERDNLTQSAISTAHFFATVPVLPYAMGANTPDECSYVLGAYRPGSCNPHQIVKPRLSLRGLVYQGAVTTGLVFLLP
ncbi:MAG: hypothetical protein AAF266_00025 [Planctomycetota bacterium]